VNWSILHHFLVLLYSSFKVLSKNYKKEFRNLFSGGDAHSARREFLSYCLSLMRAHNSEHRDSLPVLDVSALRHVAYVFDALVYYMRSLSEPLASRSETQKESSSYSSWNDQVCGI